MIKLRENTRHPLWRTPRHHMDEEHTHDHVHWIELFYDLVHVVTIFVLGNFLSHHLDVSGFFMFAGLFMVMWIAWADISWFNSLYVSTDIYHRLYMTLLIVTVMISTASIDSMFNAESAKYAELSWQYFACAYAVNRFLIAWLYRRAKKIGDSDNCLPAEMFRNYMLIGIGVLISAFVPKPYGYYLFGAVCVWHWLWFAIPKLGVMRHDRNTPRHGHLAERFMLLMLIVSGEGFFKLVLTLAEKGVYKMSADILVNYIIGAVAIFTICWIYNDFVGNQKPKDEKPWTIYKWSTAHMFIMLSAVMIGVALVGEVKVHFMEPYPMKYGILGCAGLALFLLSLTVIQHNIVPHAPNRFSFNGLRTFGFIMCGVTLVAVLLEAPSIIGNILWGTALFSQVLVGMHRALKAFAEEDDL